MEEHFEWVKDISETLTITKEEYEYLKWFRCEADFGPGHGDVIYYMHKDYKESGRKIPEGWGEDE